MFWGEFSGKSTFRGEDFSIFDSGGLRVAFYGRLYGVPKEEYPEYPADTAAVVACGYMRHGKSVFTQLEGSFVIVLWEGTGTIIVRDRHGTGPQVYYTLTHYSSSLLELRRAGCCNDVDAASLGLFLNTGYIPTGRSSFRGVHKLGAGAMLVHGDGKIKVEDIFAPPEILPVTGSAQDSGKLDEYARRYYELHLGAIGKRIEGCRDVGILLSGGYDSGCNLAALRAIYDGEVKSYSIGFRGDNWSELPLARRMSEVFGTKHHVYEIDGREIMALPAIVAHMGDPFVEGGLMVNHAAMGLAAKDPAGVILGGDGNDQYFGTSGREAALHYLAKRHGLQPILNLMYSLLGTKVAERKDAAYRLRFHLDKILHILHGDVFGIGTNRLDEYFRDPSQLVPPARERPDTRSFEHLYNQHTYTTDIKKVIDQVIVFKASRMAEMFGNRIEFPYLDTDLYDFLGQLPVCFKCHGESTVQIAKGNFTAKYLLKYKYKPLLPEVITSRRKQGGFAPVPLFFEDNARRALLGDFIMDSTVVRDLLRRDTVERFLRDYDRQCAEPRWFWFRQNHAIQFFNILTLAVWWEIFVAGKTDIRF